MLPLFSTWRNRLQMEHLNCNQRWSRETKGNISDMSMFFTQMDPMSAAEEASKLFPCSSGKSASSEPENPWNKDSVSCCQAFSSITQSQAMTSKMPHCGKPTLASRYNIVHGVPYHTKLRSELVKDGSTHREACKQIQSQDILRSKNNMNHLFNRKRSEEIIDSELPSSAETPEHFQRDTIAVPHCPILGLLSNESEEEEEEADGGLIDSWQDTHRESGLITFSRTVCQSSSVSTGLRQSPQRLQSFRSQLSMSAVSSGAPVSSDGCSVTPLLKQTRPTHVTPPPPDRDNRRFSACTQRTKQYLASPPSSTFSQRQPRLVSVEESAFQNRTSVTDTLQSSTENQGPSTSKTSDRTINGETKTLRHNQDCQGISAAEVLWPPKHCDKEIVCRFKQRILKEQLQEEKGNWCRICYSGDASPKNPLLSPCLCSGSLRFIHFDCLKTWIHTRIQSVSIIIPQPVLTREIMLLFPTYLLGSSLSVVQRCELCMGRLTVDPGMFDLDNSYVQHQQGRGIIGRFHVLELAEILIISGALLHLAKSNSQLPRIP